MINFNHLQPLVDDIDKDDESDILAILALLSGPARDLGEMKSHLETIHNSLHLSALLFGVEPDPDAHAKVMRDLDLVQGWIDRCLDSHKN